MFISEIKIFTLIHTRDGKLKSQKHKINMYILENIACWLSSTEMGSLFAMSLFFTVNSFDDEPLET